MPRTALDAAAQTDRFSMHSLHEQLWPRLTAINGLVNNLAHFRERFTPGQAQQIEFALIRHAFLIELVKVPGVTTTKFQTRWCTQLEHDQRYCSYDECLQLFAELVEQLSGEWIDQDQNNTAIELFLDQQLLPYELPIDYVTVPGPDDDTTRIHRSGNIAFSLTDNTIRTIRLRKLLRSQDTSPDPVFFSQVLDNKVKVKTYLTDRAQTGEYKTNREKRWETHPHSVQFATRSTCLEIEHVLMIQMCAFEGFPETSRRLLQEAGVLPQDLRPFRCPITLIPISFAEFKAELTNPTHGRSGFQVGHLTPLKLDRRRDGTVGHTADNISWVSADGNRIQGSMSLAAVRDLLMRIARNYEADGQG